MTNDEYTAAVDAGEFPTDPNVPLEVSFADERGDITNLITGRPLSSVAVIRSRKGAVRANHWHRTDWHYAFVVAGEVLYFERPVGSLEIPEPRLYRAGDMFFTPPNREHAMLFVTDSAILTFAKNSRDHESHESDLVRVSFVTLEIAARYVPTEEPPGANGGA